MCDEIARKSNLISFASRFARQSLLCSSLFTFLSVECHEQLESYQDESFESNCYAINERKKYVVKSRSFLHFDLFESVHLVSWTVVSDFPARASTCKNIVVMDARNSIESAQ